MPVMDDVDEPGQLTRILRYPVKSLSGEELDRVAVERRGVRGDRLWAVRDADGRLGSGKTTRRFRRMDGLLELSATYDGQVPVLSFPDGRRVRGDDPEVHEALSGHVGRPVTLGHEEAVSHFDDGPLHVVTTASLTRIGERYGGAVDPRRLRPNLVVSAAGEGFVEDGWVGSDLLVGAVRVRILAPMPRCRMVDLPQVGVPAGEGLLRAAAEVNDTCLGVLAEVVEPGDVAVGDPVRRVR